MQSQKRAKFSSEMEEFVEEFIPVLQCFSCKAVPGPEEAKRKRYNCFNESHALCENCKFRCPCGSQVCRKPSKLAEKVLNKYPWMCCHFNEGCRESRTQADELEIHQRNCYFRKVHCPIIYCHKKISFFNVFDHLESHQFFKEIVHLKLLKKNEIHVDFDLSNEGYSGYWREPIHLESAKYGHFFLNGYIEKGHIYIWVSYYGSPDEAKNFSCAINIAKDEFEVSFRGPLLTLDDENLTSVLEKPVMSLKLNLAQKMRETNGFLKLLVKIKNLKEEVKGAPQLQLCDISHFL